jgi:uncharacterized membrane protein
MTVGLLLRLPIASYAGAHTRRAFDHFIFAHSWAYSDIAALYFRDHIWLHHVPYFAYRFEYPVLTGAFVWIVGFINSSVWVYFLASALVLCGCGLVVVRLIGTLEGANPWLFALSPALALYAVLNWDLLGLALTALALWLFARHRDGWAGATLSLATWAKLFPGLLLPLLIAARVLERRTREAIVLLGTFLAVTAAANIPVAVRLGSHGLRIRSRWAFLFRYNVQRPRAVNLWNLFDSLHWSTHRINVLSAALLIAGLAGVLLALRRGAGGSAGRAAIAPAFVAILAWSLFISKVYSPQYGLWIVAALAIAGAPVALLVAFAAADVAYYAASLEQLHLQSHRFYDNVLLPSAGVRELILLAIVAWGLVLTIKPTAVQHPAKAATT